MDITDPNAELEAGFPADVMPQNYGDTLTPQQLQQLVQYLVQATGGAGGGAPKQ